MNYILIYNNNFNENYLFKMDSDFEKYRNLYPMFLDYEWFGIDIDGNISCFTNGGEGPIPLNIIKKRPEYDGAKVLISDLPIRGEYKLFFDVPRQDYAIKRASQGLYTYDWFDVHRINNKINMYEIWSKPSNPLKINDLSSEILKLIGEIRFPIRFSDYRKIEVSKYFICAKDFC